MTEKVHDHQAADAQLISPEVQVFTQHLLTQVVQQTGTGSGAVSQVSQGPRADSASDPGQVLLVEQGADVCQGVLIGRGICEESATLKRRVPRRCPVCKSILITPRAGLVLVSKVDKVWVCSEEGILTTELLLYPMSPKELMRNSTSLVSVSSCSLSYSHPKLLWNLPQSPQTPPPRGIAYSETRAPLGPSWLGMDSP